MPRMAKPLAEGFADEQPGGRQLHEADDRGDRGFLQHHDVDADGRRQDHLQRLRADHEVHDLPVPHAAGACGFPLAGGNAADAGADHLGHHRAGVQAERERGGGEGGEIEANQQRQAVIAKEQHDQDWDRAEQLGVEQGHQAQGAERAGSHQRQRQPADAAEQQGEPAQPDRQAGRLQQDGQVGEELRVQHASAPRPGGVGFVGE
jgi:hypothetical protein